MHAFMADVDEIQIHKTSLKTSGCKSFGMLIGMGLGILLGLILAMGLRASAHISESQGDRLAADECFMKENPFAVILSYPPPSRMTRSPDVNRAIEQERENVDRWFVGKAKAQLETRNLLLVENHENISTHLAQLEDESVELVPMKDGTSWGTNS